ncbi:MAG: small multi-drug export protein [Lachnospiraceae bacterium]|nr:small multi-drug export protein [Lachnospiraceae bacterium]
MQQALVDLYNQYLGSFMPKELFIFFVSMLPLVELRGGIFIASLLKIPLWKSNLICIVGNLIPIPFILLFIKRIFEVMKKFKYTRKIVEALETRASKKSAGADRGEFTFLFLFVGIPIPGTGAWTGSLIAALLEFDIKKAMLACLIGVVLATIIMDLISYGGLQFILNAF